MKKRLVGVLATLLVTGSLLAQGGTESVVSGGVESGWKANTVKIYVTTKAGNGADLWIRMITPALEKETGKKFAVINQTEGNGVVGYETVRTAKPDGSTLLYFLNSMIVQSHTGVYDKTVSENFTPIAIDTSSGSMWMVIPTSSKFQSVQDIIDEVKANPGTVTFGMTSGQALQLLGGMMENDIGSQLSMVDAGGNAERLISLLGGNIDFTFVSTGAAKQYVESNQIRILGAVTGTGKRDPIFPDIPSVTELGLPTTMFGFDSMLLGPKGMAPALVTEINKKFQDAVLDPEVVAQFKSGMNTVMTPLNVEESAQYVKDMDAKIGALAKGLGF